MLENIIQQYNTITNNKLSYESLDKLVPNGLGKANFQNISLYELHKFTSTNLKPRMAQLNQEWLRLQCDATFSQKCAGYFKWNTFI